MTINTDFFLIKDQIGGFHKINYFEILYIKSVGNYLKFATIQGETTTYGSLQSLQDILRQDARFMRIHRSYIISLVHIEHISSMEITIGQTKVPIGKKFLEELKSGFIQTYLLNI